MPIRNLLLAAALATALASGAAGAQNLPKPNEFYFDADAQTVKPVIAVRETGEAAMERLAKILERKAHAPNEAAQLGHLAMEAGRNELGRQLYARALREVDSGSTYWRSITWNYAWDLYRSGAGEEAFRQWTTLHNARTVNASWMPPTYAVALWTLGRKDEAVQWYAAAVRSEPDQWRDTSAYASLLPDWRAADRATLGEVQKAWTANPPAWP
ncbi:MULTISPECIES: tetratricopeptide repeat protein [unclassified Lysobacter]|uniref:tetratricopeptide repeat protein n=1 Tax=unclassified Lysobacter TaxID=2635362 RepID=UPI001BE63315|nr:MULTISPECIES: tetratricopeptide repeat protein [unclassified Lysobacter]MBT2747229.1 tetratricopeptide repeat protein [Lysobacter sp. ISL-42]MBT2750267.1 tetratricopeptide repeat protein [Lysobacter sp. ISL-50]MBT2777767.1 tetratricopeptide repeat protein [Lysobacter sp. ISL-54]MBT2783703.1 tetratricopeptide repeat protein [Lysobacter sp. ISL-52]